MAQKKKKSIKFFFELITIVLILTTMVMVQAWIEPIVYAGSSLPGGTLDPNKIKQFVDPLPIPGIMEKAPSPVGFSGDYYEIAMKEFNQQVLSSVDTSGKPLPQTTVWSYATVDPVGVLHYPSFSIEASVDTPVRIKWINGLVDGSGNYLSHLLPIDQTLHWANPSMDCFEGPSRTDCKGQDPVPYLGPVPMSAHLHGAHTGPESDGYPEAWWLPDANNLEGYATKGSKYDQFDTSNTDPGTAVFQYPNDQPAGTLWFHDHSLGMTRANVYAGPAGFYFLRGGAGDLPPGDLPSGAYEIPLAIQDRSFNADGSLFYPDTRAFFDAFLGPYIGDPTVDSDISPQWNPEFFGNTIVVNGKTWPYLDVEPRKYRFRILNGSDSRFLILTFNDKDLKFTVIGGDGGFLPTPVVLDELLVAPAERFDVIVDFSKSKPGHKFILNNYGPDSPFGGFPVSGKDKAHSATTGQVMEVRVVPLTAPDTTVIPASLPSVMPVDTNPTILSTRQVSLNEEASDLICVDAKNVFIPGVLPPLCGGLGVPIAPLAAKLGTVDLTTDPTMPMGMPMMWMDPFSEHPILGSTEIWEIYNFTMDAHPIHLHQVMFEVIDRELWDPMAGVPGTVFPPEVWETGPKDTVIVYPGWITRVKATFDLAGLYVWHCHILSHEDNEMMRPFYVWNTVSEWNLIAQDILQPPSMPNMTMDMPSVSMSAAFVYMSYVQAAVYNALVAIDGGYAPYHSVLSASADTSRDAAVAAAAYGVLNNYLHSPTLTAKYNNFLAAIADSPAKTEGITLGLDSADEIIALRQNDTLSGLGGYVLPDPAPGVWQPTSPAPPMDPWMAVLKPFLRDSASFYRPGDPPLLTSSEYAVDLNDVKDWGGAVSAFRTAEQTEVAQFWTTNMVIQTNAAYRQIASNRNLNLLETARLMAMGNMAATDSLIATFDAKYHYNFWRPVTAIQNADTDGNDSTTVDLSWMPAVMTPNFPEYVAGHGSFVSAQAEVYTRFFNTSQIEIDLESSVTNTTRHYADAEELRTEIVNARTWGGLHFRNSSNLAVALGEQLVTDAINDGYFISVP
ncbi:MAG: multicopper oxidase domain-containing protein [Desulfatirhabdiaceae bacterium]